MCAYVCVAMFKYTFWKPLYFFLVNFNTMLENEAASYRWEPTALPRLLKTLKHLLQAMKICPSIFTYICPSKTEKFFPKIFIFSTDLSKLLAHLHSDTHSSLCLQFIPHDQRRQQKTWAPHHSSETITSCNTWSKMLQINSL